MVERIKTSELLTTVFVNEFLQMSSGAIKAISSILISVIINGVKSSKVISKVIKIDKALFYDSSTIYRKTFVFTLVQVFAVYSYVAALFTYDTWVWKHATENTSTWFLISSYPHRTVNLGTVVQFCDLVLLLRSRLKYVNERLVSILKDSGENFSDIAMFTNVEYNSVSSYTNNKRSVSETKSVNVMSLIESPQIFTRLRQPQTKISKK
jgi:Xaa-Pro aminopeptidase